LDEIIQNGIKETNPTNFAAVEDAIQNGVKDTCHYLGAIHGQVEDVIQNGIKETKGINGVHGMNEVIQNGVKKTLSVEEGTFTSIGFGVHVEDTIQNGVKETKKGGFNQHYDMFRTIENGIKETKTPGEDGDILGALDFLSDNNTVNIPQLIDDVIENGVKYTGGIGNPKWVGKKVEDTIQNGVKETKLGAPDNRDYFIEDAIQNGVKHTEPGGYLGSIEMKGKIVHQLESPKQNEGVEDVIQNGVKYTVCSSAPFVYGVKDTLQHGVKETFDETHHRRREVVRTIRDGIKETYDDAYHHKSRVDGVIKNGIKQTCAQIPSIQPVVERILEEGILQTKPMDEWVNTNRIVDKVMTESIKETLWMNADSTNWGLEDDDLLEGYDKIEDTINNGIKEVKELPDQSGEIRGYGDYYHRQEDRTKPFTEYVNDVLEKGEKI
jgi:predicted peroxiredoxin